MASRTAGDEGRVEHERFLVRLCDIDRLEIMTAQSATREGCGIRRDAQANGLLPRCAPFIVPSVKGGSPHHGDEIGQLRGCCMPAHD